MKTCIPPSPPASQLRSRLPRRRGRRFAPATLLLLTMPWIAVAQPATPSAGQPASIRSEFIDDPKFAKDPFFPRSGRRLTFSPSEDPGHLPGHLGQIMLKGIAGPASRRLAIINNRTFSSGEEAEVRLGTETVRVRCLEVREKSVVISIHGLRKELFLGQRL